MICPDDADGCRPKSFNERMVRLLGAEVVPCVRDAVRDTVSETLDRLRSEGEIPYYIYGDETGCGNEAVPVAAYARVYPEITRQGGGLGLCFDSIYLATGTGMTQAGLVCASDGSETRIVGISIARDGGVARTRVAEYSSSFLGRPPRVGIEVVGDYLHGGYGQSDDVEKQTIRRLLLREGIPADETYVGKAFDGMLRHLEAEGAVGRHVLFIHTGGTPLFFDDMRG